MYQLKGVIDSLSEIMDIGDEVNRAENRKPQTKPLPLFFLQPPPLSQPPPPHEHQYRYTHTPPQTTREKKNKIYYNEQ